MGGQLITLADSRTAVVGTFHILAISPLFNFATRLLGLWCYFSLKRIDKMLSVSPAAAGFAKQVFRIDSEVSPNVVDYPRFHQAKPMAEYDDDNNALNILFLGRLVPRKGSLLLIEAIAQLVSLPNIPRFRVLLCGRGPLEAQLRQKIKQYNLQEIVDLVGFVSEADKPRYYATADLAVFPSSGGESFGIVLLEAMASGKAVVLAGDNPGYRSVMEPQADLLFDPKDASALAQKLAHYLTNETDRQQRAKWGGDYVQNFDVATVGASVLTIYRDSLHKRRDL
jgi:phosphatidylinositol alpha-mannosyltransferase